MLRSSLASFSKRDLVMRQEIKLTKCKSASQNEMKAVSKPHLKKKLENSKSEQSVLLPPAGGQQQSLQWQPMGIKKKMGESYQTPTLTTAVVMPSSQKQLLLRKQRAQKRLKTHSASMVTLPRSAAQRSFLEEKSVSSAGVRQYQSYFDAFTDFMKEHDLAKSSPEDLDQGALDYMDFLYFEGFRATHGEKLLASIAFMVPEVASQGKLGLPRARRALK
eukprot:9255322-Karenia_brevis.AAC.1